MKLNLLFTIAILATLSACCGQSPTRIGNGPNHQTPGDTVTELSSSIILVFQSTNGIYWFGSDKDGLYCLDGKTIIQFTTNHGLCHNRIRSIQEDKLGNIYISSLGGINKFDGQIWTTLTPAKNKLSENNWKLQPDDLWFSMAGKNGEKGPYRYDGQSLYQLEFPKHEMADEYFKRFPVNAWSPYEVYYIYKDNKGSMWFGTSNFGLCRYDGKSLAWLYEDHLTNVPNGGSFGIRSILEDTKGQYWFCNTRFRYLISPDIKMNNGNALIQYEKEKGLEGIVSPAGSDHIYFMSAVEAHNGDLWFASYNEGVWRFDGIGVTHYSVKDGANDPTVFSIYKDKNGNLWLGTHEAGPYQFNGMSFEKFKP